MAPLTPRTDVQASLDALARLPGVAASAEVAREACTRLRFNEALRRRIPQAAAESRIRGAQASAALEGADLPLRVVRDRVRGAAAWPDPADPVDEVVRASAQASAETEHLVGLVFTAPLQVLARLHVAAMAGLLPPEQVGRPRQDEETSRELIDLGDAPAPRDVADRLADVAAVLTGPRRAPVTVLSGLVHAELASMRPFVRGNGIVARAMERLVVVAGGLDPTGVGVPEVGHLAPGGPAYLGALTAYVSGGRPGVGLWLRHCAEAVTAGAVEGERICAAVRVGRLD